MMCKYYLLARAAQNGRRREFQIVSDGNVNELLREGYQFYDDSPALIPHEVRNAIITIEREGIQIIRPMPKQM